MRSAALVLALSWLATGAAAQDATLVIEPPDGDRVLTVRRDGEVLTHCPTRCELTLPAGGLEVSLHRRSDREDLALAALSLDGEATLRASTVDRNAERIVGWLLVGLVAIPGAALALVGSLWAIGGAAGERGEAPPEAWAFLAVGDVLFVAGLSLGLYFAFHFDEHRIELASP